VGAGQEVACPFLKQAKVFSSRLSLEWDAYFGIRNFEKSFMLLPIVPYHSNSKII
jgi:hypothetical protein